MFFYSFVLLFITTLHIHTQQSSFKEWIFFLDFFCPPLTSQCDNSKEVPGFQVRNSELPDNEDISQVQFRSQLLLLQAPYLYHPVSVQSCAGLRRRPLHWAYHSNIITIATTAVGWPCDEGREGELRGLRGRGTMQTEIKAHSCQPLSDRDFRLLSWWLIWAVLLITRVASSLAHTGNKYQPGPLSWPFQRQSLTWRTSGQELAVSFHWVFNLHSYHREYTENIVL